MAMWNDYEKIARRVDRIAKAFERIANALETANIIEADRKTEPSIRKFSPDIESGFIRPQTEPSISTNNAQGSGMIDSSGNTDCQW